MLLASFHSNAQYPYLKAKKMNERLWIYQSNRLLTDAECARIADVLQEFVAQWTAHGNQLLGSFEIRHRLFILLKVDESKAMVTGCSIDKSVHLLKKLESEFGISLFDRLQVAFRDAYDMLWVVHQDEFRKLVQAGEVHAGTIVYNNTVTAVADLADKWEIPLRESWHAKVFLG